VGRWKNEKYNLKRKVLMTCNPNKGYAYNNFYLPAKDDSLPEYRKFIQALPADNRYLTPDYIEALRRLPEVERERLLFGSWEYDADPTTMIGFEAINDLFTNEFVKGGTKRIVADIARYGSDRAIITVWNGLIMIDYMTFDTSSMVELQNAITALRIRYNVQNSDILVDAGGMGAGIVDNIRCKGFDAGSRATKPNFMNMKAECGYKLADLAGEIWIKCSLPDKEIEMIRQELAMLKTYQADTDGKLRILPKEKIKEHIGRSPDWLDVFIMRMWFEVKDRGVSHQRWHIR
jgi:hypothetical protein